jgi:hypothetical protein
MKIAGIDFPVDLLNALRDGKLVVFAGAGVSMGEPACLPNFKNLADMIAAGTGQALQSGEEIDLFLGRLQHEGVNVHERAKDVLSRDGLESTELHRNLLRLYPDVGKVRVVTTNFDLLFEQAAEDIFGNVPEIFRAPALPLGNRFKGIVHVHASISRSNEMVITDADFGRAYLTEGWARRFLVELFSNFTILFVGYSHNDMIMTYLARALLGSEEGPRFALTSESDNDRDRWQLLGINPINYSQPSEDDHSALDEGIRRLADLIRRGAVDWHREITAIAENPPSLDMETEDLVEYALEDDTRTRFFTEASSDPKWIDWLDERECLTPLFGNGTLNKRDRIFSWWLVEQFAYTHASKLFLLIGKHNVRLHPHFWSDLAYRIGRDRETSWYTDILSRWISLLLTTVRRDADISMSGHINTSTLLQRMGEHCIQRGMLDSLLQIFDTMMESQLRLKEGFFWPNDDEDNETPPVDAELLLIGKHNALNDLWKKGLRPKRSQVAEPLLNRVIKRLEERYITLCTWQQIHPEWDSDSRRRSAIEPHEQDRYPRSIDVLIDAARDCLEWLTSNQVDVAVQWCNRLVSSDAPLLRRLAVHGLSKREDLTADDKIDWLLTHIDLHESLIRHEVFRAVRLAYPQASPERRRALINAVWAFRWPHEAAPNNMEETARQHFKWFDWLHKSDLNCALARQVLGEVLAEYPNFEPTEHPDLTYWMTSDSGGLQSPLTPEQLLANPASHWLGNLLSFQITEWEDPNHRGLIENVAEAARRNFDWGLDLANVLGRSEEWDVYLWSALIYAWSTMELNEDKYRKVLYWLGKTELHPRHNREIAKVLYKLLREDDSSYVLTLLPQANKIAAALWHNLDQIDRSEEIDDWFEFAINYPAWDIINFWVYGFSLWRQHQDPKPTGLSNEYCRALSDIVEDTSLSGKLGRTVLASQFAFLLTVDERWTQDNLLPLFDSNSDDFQAAWSGFLTGGRLNPVVAEVMADPFLKAVEQINSDLLNQRDRFVEYYVYMLVYFVEDPTDKWIPKLFRHDDSQGTRAYFAEEVGNHLQNMARAEQQGLWQRWLKRHWENRLLGMPAGEPESGEAARMLNWLPHLTSVFPEAVDIAVQMTVSSLQDCYVIEELGINNENDLWQKHPESVVKLLIYLWECDLPRHSWHSGRDLIDNLLSSDISEQLKEKLEDIKVQLL